MQVLKNSIPYIIIGLLVILLFFKTCNNNNNGYSDKAFLKKQDSITLVDNKLKSKIFKDSIIIDSLNKIDTVLKHQITHYNTKIKSINLDTKTTQLKISTFSNHELLGFYNKRYNIDTVSNKLSLSQPILIQAAKDLVELGGDRKIILNQDTLLLLDNRRGSIKDSIINTYKNKEKIYTSIVFNQNSQLNEWQSQYNLLNKQYKIEKTKSNISGLVVVGGLLYLILHK